MIDFSLTADQRLLRDRSRAFAREHLSGIADLVAPLPTPEERFAVTRPAYEKLIADGFMTDLIPGPAGGRSTGLVDFSIMAEELIAVDPNVPLTLFANLLGLTPVLLGGTPEQVGRILPQFLLGSGAPLAAFAFSEPGGSANYDAAAPAEGTRTTAVLEGEEWVISGAKQWVSNSAGWDGSGPEVMTIVCRTDPAAAAGEGLTVLLVEKEHLASGFSVTGSFDTPGHRGHLTPKIRLDGVRVPRENVLGTVGQGSALIEAAFGGTAATVGAFGVGVMRHAFEVALTYARRESRGGSGPIIEHQAVGYLMADVKTRIEATRALTWRACQAQDAGHPGALELALHAKVFGSETAVQAICDLMRVVGIESYDATMPLARILNDALAYPLFDGGNVGVRRRQLHAMLADPTYDAVTMTDA